MRRAIWALALCLAAARAAAQIDVQFADFTRLRSYYNPAVCGTDGKLNVAGAYAMQFAGYDNAPATMYIGADLPVYFLSPRHGAGVSLLSDKAGMFTTQRISIQYAYNVRVGRKGRLAIGATAGMLTEKLDPSGLELEDQSDPAFPTSEVSGNKVDFGAGLYFYHPRVWAGLSAQHLAAPVVQMSNQKNEMKFDRTYHFMAGGSIPLRRLPLTLCPALMVMTDMQSWREDVQCKVVYEYEGRSMYAGVGYSPSTSATVMVGGNFHGICLGYSYQMYTEGVGMTNGSHEITVGYVTDLDLFKKGRNRHKSVRFL